MIKKDYSLNGIGETLKIAVISDTHGRLDERVAQVISLCDAVIHAGDICASSVVRELESLNKRVITVAGNNDTAALWPPEDHEMVVAFPEAVEIKTPGGSIVVEHGHRFGNHPDHESLRAAWPQARLVIYGHTHKQIWDQERDPWVINPGAAGHVRNQGGPACSVLTLHEDQWDVELMQFLDANDEHAA